MSEMARTQEIADNFAAVLERIRNVAQGVGRELSDITLIVVTKNFPASDVEILYNLGVRNFGENRDQEAALKVKSLPIDINWHFLGQIQSRKIASIRQWADVVHSLDSLVHARKFETDPTSRTSKFFIQVNLEPMRTDRGGVSLVELPHFLETLINLTEIVPIGLMTVAPQDVDPVLSFEELRLVKTELLSTFSSLRYLSMGMSNDFEQAIMAGATHLRIGSSILGSRPLRA